MKKLIISSLVALTAVSAVKAQQLTFNSQYMLNQYLINPAAAGSQDYMAISAGFRQQWAGFNGAPRTQMVSANTRIHDNMGVGGIIYNDVTGPLRNIGFQGSYAYHMKINDNSKLSLGMSLSLTQHILDASQFVLHQAVDNTLNNATVRSFNPDAVFGAYYYGKKFFAGISIPQLLQGKYKFGNLLDDFNREIRHYYASGGYKFDLNENFQLQPSVLLKYAPNTPFQYDINARLFYKQNMWTGISYRSNESLVAMFGMKRDKFVIGYSYDYILSNIRNYSAGTHELYLEFQLPNKKATAASFN